MPFFGWTWSPRMHLSALTPPSSSKLPSMYGCISFDSKIFSILLRYYAEHGVVRSRLLKNVYITLAKNNVKNISWLTQEQLSLLVGKFLLEDYEVSALTEERQLMTTIVQCFLNPNCRQEVQASMLIK